MQYFYTRLLARVSMRSRKALITFVLVLAWVFAAAYAYALALPIRPELAAICIGPGQRAHLKMASASAQVPSRGHETTAYDEFPRLGFPIKSAPISIVSFHLYREDRSGSWERLPRIAVLSRVGGTPRLQFFKPGAGRGLVTVFSMDAPQEEEWETLKSFPSDLHPGVIIQGEYTEAAEHGGGFADVECYVDGKLHVVFRGNRADFIHISASDMPEVIEYEDYLTPHRLRVWTWGGKKYHLVAIIRHNQLFSPSILQAIQAVKVKHKATSADL